MVNIYALFLSVGAEIHFPWMQLSYYLTTYVVTVYLATVLYTT